MDDLARPGESPTGGSPTIEQPFDPAGQFFNMCGGRPPLKILVTDDDTREQTELQVNQPFAVVGRSDRCHIQLPDADVSRRHAYLQVIDGRVFCCDLKSRNGTYWNGKRRRLGWVDGTWQLQIGPYSIELPEAGCEELSDDPLSDDPLSRLPTRNNGREPVELTGPVPCLEFLNARRRQDLWEINRDITLIGRGRGCKLQLDDGSISDIHVALVRTPTALWMIDLLGQGGTFINDEPVGFAELHEGQELRIGEFRLGIRFAEPHSASDVQPPAALSPTDSGKIAVLKPQQDDGILAGGRPCDLAPTLPPAGGRPVVVPGCEGKTPRDAGDERLSEQFVLSIMRQFAECQADSIRQTQASLQAVLSTLNNVHENQRLLVENVVRRLRNRTESDDSGDQLLSE